MLTFDSTPTSDYQPIHPIEPDEELDERSKIPFNFLHIPFRLIDDDIIASLDGNTVKALTIICRYLNLTEKVVIGKRVILSGWGIPISYDHIAKKTGLSRRTVIRKVKILVEREILLVEKVGRCNSYRLTEYAICIDEVTTIYEGQAKTTASEQQSQSRQSSHQATATEQQTPEDDEPVIKPGVPTDERLQAKRPAHIKASAKEAVASQVYARHCLAGIGNGDEYTDEDIEKLWAEAYQRFGQPENADEWFKDRIHLWHKQTQWGKKETITDADTANVWIKADKVFAEKNTVESDKSANENVTSDV